jgi:hypothetical protein
MRPSEGPNSLSILIFLVLCILQALLMFTQVRQDDVQQSMVRFGIFDRAKLSSRISCSSPFLLNWLEAYLYPYHSRRWMLVILRNM